MLTRVTRRRSFRSRFLVVLMIASLLAIPTGPFFAGTQANTQRRAARDERKGNPKPGKPETTLPNLDEVKNETRTRRRELTVPIPSTIRSRKTPLQPWDGRRVGEEHLPPKSVNPEEPRGSDLAKAATPKRSTRSQTSRAHASRKFKASAPTPVLDDDFINEFYEHGLAISPWSAIPAAEKSYWQDLLRVAYAKGQTSLKLAAIEMGKSIFESAA